MMANSSRKRGGGVVARKNSNSSKATNKGNNNNWLFVMKLPTYVAMTILVSTLLVTLVLAVPHSPISSRTMPVRVEAQDVVYDKDVKQYSYICLEVNQDRCFGISPGQDEPYWDPDNRFELQIKPRLNNERSGDDYKKTRWDVDFENSTISLSRFSNLCVARDPEPEINRLYLQPCDSSGPRGKFFLDFQNNINQRSEVRLKDTDDCATVMECQSGGKTWCNSESTDIQTSSNSGAYEPGSYVKLRPCWWSSRGSESWKDAQTWRQRLDCAVGCPPYLQENDVCDEECNNEECGWDNMECATDSPTPPTFSPTLSPTPPTRAPTRSPTKSPTKAPSHAPSPSPTRSPSLAPSPSPTMGPTTLSPTVAPSPSPTKGPTKMPTKSPTKMPTRSPTKAPTKMPTVSPTKMPTKSPTPAPTKAPSTSPTPAPSASPTVSPTFAPTATPTASPTKAPTVSPTPKPTPERNIVSPPPDDDDALDVQFVLMIALPILLLLLLFCCCYFWFFAFLTELCRRRKAEQEKRAAENAAKENHPSVKELPETTETQAPETSNGEAAQGKNSCCNTFSQCLPRRENKTQLAEPVTEPATYEMEMV